MLALDTLEKKEKEEHEVEVVLCRMFLHQRHDLGFPEEWAVVFVLIFRFSLPLQAVQRSKIQKDEVELVEHTRSGSDQTQTLVRSFLFSSNNGDFDNEQCVLGPQGQLFPRIIPLLTLQEEDQLQNRDQRGTTARWMERILYDSHPRKRGLRWRLRALTGLFLSQRGRMFRLQSLSGTEDGFTRMKKSQELWNVYCQTQFQMRKNGDSMPRHISSYRFFHPFLLQSELLWGSKKYGTWRISIECWPRLAQSLRSKR